METYTAERILDKRVEKKSKRVEYYVKWLNFPEKESTWESRKDLIGEGNKQLIDVYEEESNPPTAAELRRASTATAAPRGRTRTPGRATRRARSKTPVRRAKAASLRRSGRKSRGPKRFNPSLPNKMLQGEDYAADGLAPDSESEVDNEAEEEADLAVEADEVPVKTDYARPPKDMPSAEEGLYGRENSAGDVSAQRRDGVEDETENAEGANDTMKESDDAARAEDDAAAAAAAAQAGVMFSDVAQLGNLRSGILVLAALAAATLHLVLLLMMENETFISRKDTTLMAETPQLMGFLVLGTRVLPTLVAFMAVRASGSDPKNYSRSAYITFLDISLIWCIATDVIEYLTLTIETPEPANAQLVITCTCIISHLCLVVAFSSELADAKELPALRPELMVVALAGAGGLAVLSSPTGSALNCKPEVVALLVTVSCAVWRATARLGYGNKTSLSYGALSQWLGLLGVMALAVSVGLLLCEFGEFKLGISAEILKTARLTNYWIGLGALAASAKSPGDPTSY